MREIKIKFLSKDFNYKTVITPTEIYGTERVSEFINLVDQLGQDIYTGDLVLIENGLIHKQFLVVFNQEKLGYCFQTNDQEQKPFSMQEIRGIFGNNFTVTKTGNIYKQGG